MSKLVPANNNGKWKLNRLGETGRCAHHAGAHEDPRWDQLRVRFARNSPSVDDIVQRLDIKIRTARHRPQTLSVEGVVLRYKSAIQKLAL